MNCLRWFLRRSSQERLCPDQPVGYWYYQGSIQRCVFASRFVPGKDILDLGCGTGCGIDHIARKGARIVVGADLDSGAIRYAAGRFPQASYVCADATRLPIRDESFDVVICFEVIEHVGDPRSLVSECRRVLRDEGVFVCSTPNRDTHYALARSPYHVHEFSLAELHAALSEQFQQVTLAGQHYININSIRMHKVKQLAAVLVSAVLPYLPFGSQIRQMLARSTMPENRRIPFNDDFQEVADPAYEVVHRDSRPGQTPTTLVAVARKQAQRGAGAPLPRELERQNRLRYAPEYVEAMSLMLQQDEPRDYVSGTGAGGGHCAVHRRHRRGICGWAVAAQHCRCGENAVMTEQIAGASLLPRHRAVLCASTGLRAQRLLDVGCGDGSFTTVLGRIVHAIQIYGIELSSDAAADVSRRGINVVLHDLRQPTLPFKDRVFDLVFAGEIIEHLRNTDGFLQELHRVLRPGGVLVLTTPNIASWYCRIQLLLGFQPYAIHVSDMVAAGMMCRSTLDEQNASQLDKYCIPSGRAGEGHVRFFSVRALVALLSFHGFAVHKTIGTTDIPTFKLGKGVAQVVHVMQGFFSRLPSLAAGVVVVARRGD